jgi:hypothetical protein
MKIQISLSNNLVSLSSKPMPAPAKGSTPQLLKELKAAATEACKELGPKLTAGLKIPTTCTADLSRLKLGIVDLTIIAKYGKNKNVMIECPLKYAFPTVSFKSGIATNGVISKVGSKATRKFSTYATKVLGKSPISASDFLKVIKQFNTEFADASEVKVVKKEPSAMQVSIDKLKKSAFRVRSALVAGGIDKTKLSVVRYGMSGAGVACVFHSVEGENPGYAVFELEDAGSYRVGKCAGPGAPQNPEFLSQVKEYSQVEDVVAFLLKSTKPLSPVTVKPKSGSKVPSNLKGLAFDRKTMSGVEWFEAINGRSKAKSHIEGYWRPEFNAAMGSLPFPIIMDVKGYDKAAFLAAYDGKVRESRQTAQKGFSRNRWTGGNNGDVECHLGAWIWPKGLRVYFSAGVPPSSAFYKFVTGKTLPSLPLYGRTK